MSIVCWRPSEYKELERIHEGDVVFCLNGDSVDDSLFVGIYFSNTIEIDQQKALLSSLLDTAKRFSLCLLDLNEFTLD